MFAGQMACEAFNFGLKRLIREERPKRMKQRPPHGGIETSWLMTHLVEITGKGYGMPSSHAQFMAFFAISLSLFLIVRHIPTRTTSYSPTTFVERILLSLIVYGGAGAVAASRVYLNYHTPRQVWVGVAAGANFAVLWFLFTAYLRHSGWLGWGLDIWPCRELRVRDLITTEDIQDAGWERWQERRRVERGAKSISKGKKVR